MMKKVKLKYKSVQVLPQTVTDAVMSNDMQRSLTDILAEKVSKVGDDTIAGELEMSKGIHSDDYEEGMSGYKLGKGDDGSYLQVDVLKVLKRTDLNEVRIASIKHVGGTIVASPASCKVVVLGYASDISVDHYMIYFSATDGESTVTNDWEVDDLALCKTYNGGSPRFYWRRVTAVYKTAIDGLYQINLSGTDCAEGSGAPMVGDELVCFGNVSNPERQNAIILSSSSSNAPLFLQLTGINSYNINDSNKVTQLSPDDNIIRGASISFKTKNGSSAELANLEDCGIDIENGTITLGASNTIVKGDLSVQKVMTYYPNGSVKSAYNGNGNGTIVYYYPIENTEVGYPFGQQMRVDDFVYDDNGNAVGMKTIYFKQDGGVAWVLSSSGLETTLSEYWSYLYDRVFDTDLVSLKAKIDKYKMNLAAKLPGNISDFSQFHSTTQTDKDGRIVKGRMATSALPPLKPSGYYSGVFCLNQPLEVLVPQDGPSVPKNMCYPYWVVDKGVIIEQGNYYFAP